MDFTDICIIAAVVVGVVLMVLSFLLSDLIIPTDRFAIFIVSFMLFGIAAFGGVCNHNIKKAVASNTKYEKYVQAKIDSGYKVYLDGKKVEANNIDFRKYHIKIDTKQKKVLCTR